MIAGVTSEAQAGFIPGRKLFDNFILAHELIKDYFRKHRNHVSARCMIKIDLQKVSDSVERIYLRQAREELAFP